MTTTPDRVVAPPRHGAAALWAAPLWMHALVLLVILVVLSLVTRPGVAYTSDEGAGVAQARLLEAGTWHASNPVPTIDPDGRFSPFPVADVGEKGVSPYAKHPLFPLILRVADDLGGERGLLAVSIAGTVGAALAAAAIAAVLRPGLARPALWAIGLGSPLLFDSFIIVGHSLAAAAFGFAALVAIVAVTSWTEPGPRPRRVLSLVLMAALVATTVGLRTEGVFAGLALALGAAAVAWRSPTARRPAVAVAAVAAVATALAVLAERLARLAIIGTPVAAPGDPVTVETSSWLPGRAEALWNDWFDPGVGAVAQWLVLALVAVTVMLAFAAWKSRRDGPEVVAVVLVVATAIYAVRLLTSPPVELFGLMVAMPLLWIGILLVRRADVSRPAVLALVVTISAFSLGVLLTNYSVGGSIQWGGRYYALALPLAVPVALVALRRLVGAVPRRRSSIVIVIGLVGCCLLTSALAMRVLRERHGQLDSLTRSVAAATATAAPIGVGSHPDRPLVVVGNRLVPQLLYGDLDRYVWLAAGQPDSVRDALRRSADAGVTSATVVNPPADGSLWPGWREVSRRGSELGEVAVIEVCAPSGC